MIHELNKKINKLVEIAYKEDVDTQQHLKYCVELLKEVGCTDREIFCVMCGHELIEDGHNTEWELEHTLNPEIARRIDVLSRMEGIPYSAYISTICSKATADPIPLILKLVDLDHHISRYIADDTKSSSHLTRYILAEAKLKATLQENIGIVYSVDTRTMLKHYFTRING